MIQDSVLVDSAVYGLQNVAANDGGNVALSGIVVVFLGLVLIALTIHLFNRFIGGQGRTTGKQAGEDATGSETPQTVNAKDIPEDHLIAITTAIELYRRLHYDELNSRVTFARGEDNSGWKVGYKYGQRQFSR